MRAVWSFWSVPHRARTGPAWLSDYHHLLSWSFSVEQARKYFASTTLVTDSEGARLLVDRLGLKFDEVSTDLDALVYSDPAWWTLGKLYAYRAQREPFLHIDSDAFFFEALSPALLEAPLVAQSIEKTRGLYRPELFTSLPWKPKEWKEGLLEVPCCGVVGGKDTDFLRIYADLAISMVESESNRWWKSNENWRCNALVEQYFLGAMAEHHERSISYLVPDIQTAGRWDRAREIGFTHLMGERKTDPRACAWLEEEARMACENVSRLIPPL
jgi:hypothetical protein